MSTTGQSSIVNWLRSRWRQINGPLQSRDLWASFWGMTGLALLMFSYFLVRPIRETHGTLVGSGNLNKMFLMTFGALVLVTPVWGWLVRVCSRRWLPFVLMIVISTSLVGFAGQFRNDQAPTAISMAFFVWVSVFNYMMVSMYWSLMVDSFTPEVCRRTFGVIAAGGSAGAMLGPLASAFLARRAASSTVLLIAAGLFLAVPVFLWMIPPQTSRTDLPSERSTDGDSVWAGLVETLKSRYLLGIAGYMLLGSILGSLLYVHQLGAISAAVPLEADKRHLNSMADLAANVLTLIMELVIAGPLLAWKGLGAPLLALPLIGLVAAPLLTWSPNVTAIATIMVVRRAIEYGLAKPTRELLFTVVSRSQKYKSKNFIDTVVARAGDSVGSSLSSFAAHQHWPPVAALWLGVPISVVFGSLGLWLQHRQHQLAESVQPVQT